MFCCLREFNGCSDPEEVINEKTTDDVHRSIPSVDYGIRGHRSRHGSHHSAMNFSESVTVATKIGSVIYSTSTEFEGSYAELLCKYKQTGQWRQRGTRPRFNAELPTKLSESSRFGLLRYLLRCGFRCKAGWVRTS